MDVLVQSTQDNEMTNTLDIDEIEKLLTDDARLYNPQLDHKREYVRGLMIARWYWLRYPANHRFKKGFKEPEIVTYLLDPKNAYPFSALERITESMGAIDSLLRFGSVREFQRDGARIDAIVEKVRMDKARKEKVKAKAKKASK